MKLNSIPVGIGLLLVVHGSGYAEPLAAPRQVSAAIPTGTRSYAPGTWGLVEVAVANPSDRPATVLSSFYFQGFPNQQYGRELWLPPKSRRLAWHPVFVPPEFAADGSTLGFNSLLLDRTDSEERLIASPSGQMLSDGVLPLSQPGAAVGWIGAADEDERAGPGVGDMITASRISTLSPRKVVALRGLVLPSEPEALQGMQYLVLSGDRPGSDPAGLAAIRQWVRRGGRLWILLNDVSPSTVERLLGDEYRVQTVDRIGLTEVRIEAAGSGSGPSESEAREFEVPVELVRVLADGAQVLHTVDGWPASFSQPFGHGEVLFTTLSPAGWVRPTLALDRAPIDGLGPVPWTAGSPLTHLSSRLSTWREDPAPPAAVWEPHLAEQIGYRVVGRGTVASVLGLNCVVLAGLGVWLGRRGRLERMAWAVPLTSLVSAGVLAAVGLRTTTAVTSTVAEGQLIEAAPTSSDVQVSGLLMLYNRDTGKVELGASDGGIFLPDMTGFAGEPRRMVWTDWDAWHWENLTLPRGVRVAPFRKQVRLTSPPAARGSFGPDGFAGRVTGPLQDLSDAVVTAASGETLAARLGAGGELWAGPNEVLPPGTFVSASILTDDQRRRQALFQRLLGSRPGGRFRDRATLLAWTRPLDLGFVYPNESVRTGAALVALPLEIERTPPGTRVVIPTPFVSAATTRSPEGATPSDVFNDAGEPVERTGNLESWLRFELPGAVVPLALDRADLTLAVSGPIDELELLGRTQGRTESLRVWKNPAGTLRFAIDRPEVLGLDPGGGLPLGLRVRGTGAAAGGNSEDLSQYWRIESMRLGAAGRTDGPSSAD